MVLFDHTSRVGRATWQEVVERPAGDRHIVLVYREDSFLHRAVAKWTAPSLREGGAALLVCTPSNAAAILDLLDKEGIDARAAMEEGRLLVVDAEELMSRFMTPEGPDAQRFQSALRALLGGLAPKEGSREIRAWGEMVSVLWVRGEETAARRLEGLWNEALDEREFRLLCSYRMDNLAAPTHDGPLREVCVGHTRLLPEEDEQAFEAAVDRTLMDLFGEEDARGVAEMFTTRRPMPTQMPRAQSLLMALHEVDPRLGRRVLDGVRSKLRGRPA